MTGSRNLFFVLLISFTLVCCGSSGNSYANQTAAKPAQTISAANTKTPSATSAATPLPVETKYYKGKGVVTKVDLKIGSVELDHEEIKGLMPAMRMEFYVTDAERQLKDLKTGDKVDFVLEDKGGAEKISEIKKR